MSYLPIEDYEVDFNHEEYINDINDRLQNRLDFILKKNNTNEGYDALPKETEEMMRQVINEL